MRSLRYLNTILTILAVLLTLNLWVSWNNAPGGQAMSVANTARAAGIPDAGAQRMQIIDLLKKTNVELAAMQKTLTNGSIRVHVEGGEKNKH